MSTEYVVTGLVEYVGEEVQVSATFTNRELVVQTEEQYPQFISIKFTQGKGNNELDKVKIGSRVTASINLRGRKWVNPQGETKYFNDIQGWKLSIDTSAPGAINVPAAAAPAQKFVFTATDGTEAAYRANGWTEAQMVQHKKGHYETVAPAAPSAPVSAPAAPAAPAFKEEEHDDLPF